MGGINGYAYVNGNPVSFTDPLGLFSPRAHFDMTNNGAIQAGLSPNLASQLGFMVRDVDKNTQAGMQSHMHAMCPSGWPVDLCQKNFDVFIKRQLAKCTLPGLANATHALQDSYAGGHRGFQPYTGDFLDLPFKHFIEDFFPSEGVSRGVSNVTENIIKQFTENCSCRK